MDYRRNQRRNKQKKKKKKSQEKKKKKSCQKKKKKKKEKKKKKNVWRQNKNTAVHNIWDTAKAVLREKFTSLSEEIKILSKQPNLTPKGTRKRRTKTKVNGKKP